MKKRFLRQGIGNDTGFSLVEVMVALVIGMLGVIIMMQVFAVSEGQKRSTTGAGDAQNNGAMALYTLQRDIRQGGHGFSSVNVLGCALKLPAPASRTLAQLAPVIINPPVTEVPAGDANTDTLLIAYGSSAGSPDGDAITLISGSQLGMTTPTNFAKDHWVIAAPSAATTGCSLALTKIKSVAAPNVEVDASGAVEKGFLFNLGSAPKILAYAVRSGDLTVCDYMSNDCSLAASYTPIANDIVSLRAEYGRASALVGVDTWDQTSPASVCPWTRTKALRIAVVARNRQPDKDVLTALAPIWEGSNSVVPVPIILSGKADWQNYRYKVFETAIPIRNLSWMKSCL